jgi:predicted dehydrogenase
VLLTLSHPIDYLRWLLGEVVQVSAMTSREAGLEIDVEDTALVHLQFDSGTVASLVLDYVQRPMEHSLTIVGTEGVIRWNYAEESVVLEGRQRRSSVRLPDQFERNDMFLSEMKHFLKCIEGKDTPVCPVEDGAQTLRVCLAALESARIGSRVHV